MDSKALQLCRVVYGQAVFVLKDHITAKPARKEKLIIFFEMAKKVLFPFELFLSESLCPICTSGQQAEGELEVEV